MEAMRIGTLRRGRAEDVGPGVGGVVRLDRRTKNLTKRLRPGDIAVIDHVDIDRVSADALVGCRIGGSASKTSPSLTGKWLKTVFSTTPARLAISMTLTASNPRSANSSAAASTMRARVS